MKDDIATVKVWGIRRKDKKDHKLIQVGTIDEALRQSG